MTASKAIFSLENSNRNLDRHQVIAVGDQTEESRLADEELAKKLQVEWNNESRGSVSAIGAGDGNSVPKKDNVGTGELLANGKLEVKDNTTEDGPVMEAIRFKNQPTALSDPKGKTPFLCSPWVQQKIQSLRTYYLMSPLTFDLLKYMADLQSHWETDEENASYVLLTRC